MEWLSESTPRTTTGTRSPTVGRPSETTCSSGTGTFWAAESTERRQPLSPTSEPSDAGLLHRLSSLLRLNKCARWPSTEMSMRLDRCWRLLMPWWRRMERSSSEGSLGTSRTDYLWCIYIGMIMINKLKLILFICIQFEKDHQWKRLEDREIGSFTIGRCDDISDIDNSTFVSDLQNKGCFGFKEVWKIRVKLNFLVIVS